ncbi:MAG: glycoside hydrolase family 127 protein [Bacteroidota bacterium]
MKTRKHDWSVSIIGALLLLILATGCKRTYEEVVNPKIPVEAESFDLAEIQLKDSPFREARATNAGYLLSLEPDRFLAWFREEAGLEPKGEVYGGWESEGYVIAGHTLGHYLSALSKHYNATGDERFKERVDYIVKELALVQGEHEDGYVAAIQDGREVFEEISEGNIQPDGFSLNETNVPWYNLDKTFNGLTDAYLLAENEQALEVVTKLTNWAYNITKDLSHQEWQEMLSVEFGGMNHSLADLYAITGNPKHLELAEKFYHHEVLDPLSNRKDELEGLHANTQIPKVRGVAKIHELTDNQNYHTIAEFFWNRVVNAHTYVNGGHGHEESFGPPNQLSERLNHTTETCNTYNMLWLTRILFRWDPDGELIDYYERALYNHILASQNPKTGMFLYKGYLDMPARKGFSDSANSFWCCVGTGMENHTNYEKDVYYRSGDSLYVNLFMATELEWEEKSVVLEQETDFPVKEDSRLTISTGEPVELSLLIREPDWWVQNMEISVNGVRQQLNKPANGYHEIRRNFNDGDVIEISMPMEHRIETMPDDKDRVAFFYGPVLLNAILEENPHGDGNEETKVPQLKGSKQQLLNALEPVEGKDLHFRAEGVGRIKNEDTGQWETTDIYLKPQYQTVNELYSVYMDIQ